jgi:hypothetical protein
VALRGAYCRIEGGRVSGRGWWVPERWFVARWRSERDECRLSRDMADQLDTRCQMSANAPANFPRPDRR